MDTNSGTNVNPYTSPGPLDAPLAERKFRLAAVIVGWLVDVGGSLLVGIVIGILMVVLGVVKLQAHPRNDPQGIADQMVAAQPWLSPLTYVLGYVFTALGGYVTARMAWQAKVKHAFCMGCMSTISGTALLLLGSLAHPMPDVMPFLLSGLNIPVAMFGGLLGAVRKQEPSRGGRVSGPRWSAVMVRA